MKNLLSVFVRENTLWIVLLLSTSLLFAFSIKSIEVLSTWKPVEALAAGFITFFTLLKVGDWAVVLRKKFSNLINFITRKNFGMQLSFLFMCYAYFTVSLYQFALVFTCQSYSFIHKRVLANFVNMVSSPNLEIHSLESANAQDAFERYKYYFPGRDDVYLLTLLAVDRLRGTISNDRIRTLKRNILIIMTGGQQLNQPENLAREAKRAESNFLSRNCICDDEKFKQDRVIYYARLFVESTMPPGNTNQDRALYISEYRKAAKFINYFPANLNRKLYSLIQLNEADIQDSKRNDFETVEELRDQIEKVNINTSDIESRQGISRSLEYHMALDYVADGYLRRCDDVGKRLAVKYFNEMLSVRRKINSNFDRNDEFWTFPHVKMGLYWQIKTNDDDYVQNIFGKNSVKRSEEACLGARKFVLSQLREYSSFLHGEIDEAWGKNSIMDRAIFEGNRSILKVISAAGWKY